MSNITCTPTIEDYCWLNGSDPASWKSWCPWIYKNSKGELTRYNGYATVPLLIEPFAEQAYIGSERKSANGRYYDYWLKINLNLPAGDFQTIEGLTIQKPYSITSPLGWCAFLFKYQLHAIPSPIGTPPNDWKCSMTKDTPTLPLNSINLSNHLSLVAMANSTYADNLSPGQIQFKFNSFELLPNDDGIYYINIKLKSIANNTSLSLGSSILQYSPSTFNNNVKTLQLRLQELGYYKDDIDGYFGPNTKTAVSAFQKARNLTADGSVGPATKAELKYGSAVYEPMSKNIKWICYGPCNLTPRKYQIIYYGNNGESTPKSDAKDYDGTGILIQNNTFSKNGYAFNSWNTKPDGTGIPYEPLQPYNSTTPLTLYAQWSAKTYTINLNPKIYHKYTPKKGSPESTLLSVNNISDYIESINGKPYSATQEIKVIYDTQTKIKIKPNAYCDLAFPSDINKYVTFGSSGEATITVDNKLINLTAQTTQLNFEIYPKHIYIKLPFGTEYRWYYNQDLGEFFTPQALLILKSVNKIPGLEKMIEVIKVTLSDKINYYDKNSKKTITSFETAPIKYSSGTVEGDAIELSYYNSELPDNPLRDEVCTISQEPYIYGAGWSFNENMEDMNTDMKANIPIKGSRTVVYVQFKPPALGLHLSGSEGARIEYEPNVSYCILDFSSQTDKNPNIKDIKFWSLTKLNGTPHYRKGDYLGFNKPYYDLYATTIEGRDFEIGEKGE